MREADAQTLKERQMETAWLRDDEECRVAWIDNC